MKASTPKIRKTPFIAAFSVGAVLFSAHAGGGFATGNQANTYYVGLGWTGVLSAIVAMLLLTLTMREAMIMYNSRGLKTYKQLFETLYHPFDKFEWAFEIFFYIMVLMAVAAAISGAASALNNYFTLDYYVGIMVVGLIVLALTIFGFVARFEKLRIFRGIKSAPRPQRHRLRLHHRPLHDHLHGRPHQYYQVRLRLLRLPGHRRGGDSLPHCGRLQKPQILPQAHLCQRNGGDYAGVSGGDPPRYRGRKLKPVFPNHTTL